MLTCLDKKDDWSSLHQHIAIFEQDKRRYNRKEKWKQILEASVLVCGPETDGKSTAQLGEEETEKKNLLVVQTCIVVPQY